MRPVDDILYDIAFHREQLAALELELKAASGEHDERTSEYGVTKSWVHRNFPATQTFNFPPTPWIERQ